MSDTTIRAPAMFTAAPRTGFLDHPLLDIFRSPDLRRVLPLIAICSTFYNLIALALPMAILQIIDRVLANQSIETLVFIVIGVLVALVFEEGLRAINTLITGWLGARFEHAASIAALDRLMRVPQRFIKRDEPGVHVERISAAGRVADFYSGQALLVIFDLPFVVVFLFMIYTVAGWVAIVPVAILTIFAGVIWEFGDWIRARIAERQVNEQRRFNFLQEVFAGIHSVKTMAMEAQMERRHESLQEHNADINLTMAYGSAMAGSTGMLFSQVMVVAVVFAGAWAVLAGEMTPGALAACMLLSVRALQPLRRCFSIWLRYQSFLSSHAKLREIAQMPWNNDSDKQRLPPVSEQIELRGVIHSHVEGSYLFRDLNLCVRAGECIGIRGGSGSGKSTLMTLLNGADRPDAGELLVDGRKLVDFRSDSVRHQIALLPQTGAIFSGTVLENLTMFEPSLSQSVLELSQQLGLDRVVSRMRLGYQTPLGEGNIETLPAGVRQMISIVRALARGPSVILFDEANTSLDMEGDSYLKNFLATKKGKCAMILVTHRPSMLSLADRILVLENGVLTERSQSQDRASSANAKVELPPVPEKPLPSDDYEALVRRYFAEETDLMRSVVPMLRALKWEGSQRELAEAMPQLLRALDLTAYCSVMANLGFHPRRIVGRLDNLDTRFVPCLFVPVGQSALVVRERMADGRLLCFDSATAEESAWEPDSRTGEIFVFKILEAGAAAPTGGFFSSLLLRFKPHIALILALTICSTVLALTPPLFVKSIYDHVLPTGDLVMQSYLILGIAIVLTLDFFLRRLKGRIMAHVAGRAEYIVGNMIFNRILALPSSSTESVSVNRQVGRMRSFESLRDFFMGPLAVIVFDVPASLVLVIAIAFINPLALSVILMGALGFVILALASRGTAERSISQSGRAAAIRREFLDEAIDQIGIIRGTGSRDVWVERFRHLCSKTVTSNFRDQQFQARVNGAAQAWGTATGLVALGVSAYAAIQGSISGGSMLATMMIVWRLTGPMQNFFVAASAMVKIRATVLQIENLMRLPTESAGRVRAAVKSESQGAIDFARVSFRYSNDADPALLGINVAIKPGQIVVITGPNGSGKSTLLKMITRAFSPQAGTIRFDGLDIRQLTAGDLRSRISYMPQNCDLFYGTVAQNLRLAHPSASDAELEWAASMANILDEIMAMPNGFRTRISDNQSDQLPNGFKQRLALARTLLKPASVVILDEPGTGLDDAGEAALVRCIEWLRGRATLVIVSHRPAHMRLADTVIFMEHGSVGAVGPFEAIKGRLVDKVRR